MIDVNLYLEKIHEKEREVEKISTIAEEKSSMLEGMSIFSKVISDNIFQRRKKN